MAARVNVCECYSVRCVCPPVTACGQCREGPWSVLGAPLAAAVRRWRWARRGRDKTGVGCQRCSTATASPGGRHLFGWLALCILPCLLHYHYSSLVIILPPTKLHPFLRKTKGKIVEIKATENSHEICGGTRVAAGGGVQQYDEMSRYKGVDGSDAVLWLLVINILNIYPCQLPATCCSLVYTPSDLFYTFHYIYYIDYFF